MVQAKKRVGRPSKFTEDIKTELLERMRSGESTREICRDPKMPTWSMLGRYLDKDKEFREQYAQARELMVDAWVLDNLAIAHNRSRDTQTFEETIESEKGTTHKTRTCSDNSASQRDRLIVDTAFKAAALLLPKKYGTKVFQEHTGADGGPIEFVDAPKEENLDEWAKRITQNNQRSLDAPAGATNGRTNGKLVQ